MSASPRIVWITGAAGFIGSSLASFLGEKGERCFGLDRRAPATLAIPAEQFIAGPVSEQELAALLGRSGQPAVVFHLAGGSAVGPSFADPEADFVATVGSTSSLLGFLRRYAPRAVTVLASSAAVYGSDHDGAISEDAALHPVSPYGVHKLMMEDLARYQARFFGLDIRIARLFSVYGVGLRKQLLWDLCENLSQAENVALGGSGNELRDFIHADDAVRALDLLSRVDAGQRPLLVNVGSGKAGTVASIATVVAQAWRARTGRSATIAFDGHTRAGDPASLIADTHRMSGLGFRAAIAFDHGASGYVDWYVAGREPKP